MSIKNLLLSLKDIIEGKNIVFVTDGLNAYVDAIRKYFQMQYTLDIFTIP